MKAQKCRSCKAKIIWVPTAAGKLMPLDLERTPDGNVAIEGGRAVVMSGPVPGGTGRKSHFATCPQADQWRRDGQEVQQ